MSDAEVMPAVGVAGHGGMPGMPATSFPSNQEAAAEPELDGSEKGPTPPPRVGGLVDEVYNKCGDANDIIAVQRADGQLAVYDFNVFFNRRIRASGGAPGAPSVLSTTKRAVHIYVNGKLQPQLYMRVQEDGFCAFPDGNRRPRSEALRSGLGLVPGVNNVRFEIRFLRDARVLVAECFAFLWSLDTPVIVMDIDGTITRSDVPGLLMTISPGIYDHTHGGICGLLARLVGEGAQVLYLTSRPISLASKTRSFLASLKQGEVSLPLGALHCCLEKVERVIWRETTQSPLWSWFRATGSERERDGEVVDANSDALRRPAPQNTPQVFTKNMHEYKASTLQRVVFMFREAGKTFGEPVFAAGVGNKFTDAVAYRAAGIPKESIFLIDTSSTIQVWDGDASKVGGTSDGQALVPNEKPPQRPASKRRGLRKRFLGIGGGSGGSVAVSTHGTGSVGSTQSDDPDFSHSSHASLPDLTPAMSTSVSFDADTSRKSASGPILAREKKPDMLHPKTKVGSSKHLTRLSRSKSETSSPDGFPDLTRTASSGPVSNFPLSSEEQERAKARAESKAATTVDENDDRTGSERWKNLAGVVTRQDPRIGTFDSYADEQLFLRLKASMTVTRGKHVTLSGDQPYDISPKADMDSGLTKGSQCDPATPGGDDGAGSKGSNTGRNGNPRAKRGEFESAGAVEAYNRLKRSEGAKQVTSE